MKLSIGDVIDRWTIAYLKNTRGQINTYGECEEYRLYSENYNQDMIVSSFQNLLLINGKIWNLESDIRKGKEGELGLEEVGRRALQIRDLNRERIDLKNKLNEFFKEGFQEIKINHGSQL